MSFDQAELLKIGISQNRVPQHQRSAVQDAIQKTLDVWLSGVELALGEFKNVDHLPHRLLLCGGGSSLDTMIDRLEQSSWYKSLPFTKKPTVQHINPSQVVGIIDKTGAVDDHTYITAMGLLRVGADTAGSDKAKSSDSFKARIDRMLQV
jgi:cell division protein FtsA